MSQRLAVGILIASAVAVSVLFLASMLDYTGGGLSAPLDDSFIYFQYAKRLSEGHPFESQHGRASDRSVSVRTLGIQRGRSFHSQARRRSFSSIASVPAPSRPTASR